jgi:putative transposase
MVVKTQTNVYETHYHFVFVTKYRQDIFTTKEKQEAMKGIMQKVADEQDFVIENMEVADDHVHLMVTFKPKYAISDIVKKLKGTSARRWFISYPETKEKLWGGHLWTPSYYAGTLGNVSKEIVYQYINEQLTEYNAGRPRRDSPHE